FDGDITRSWHCDVLMQWIPTNKVDIDVSFDYNTGDNARGVPAMDVNKNNGLGIIGGMKSKELLRGWAKNCSLSKNWPMLG
ncbi:hypothetical protein, partial [Enterovibrio norvegicus]